MFYDLLKPIVIVQLIPAKFTMYRRFMLLDTTERQLCPQFDHLSSVEYNSLYNSFPTSKQYFYTTSDLELAL